MGVCIYIYITYQIKKCVYNKKACVYVYVRGCFDKYISAATWPPQIKISGSAPVCKYVELIINAQKKPVSLCMKTSNVYQGKKIKGRTH